MYHIFKLINAKNIQLCIPVHLSANKVLKLQFLVRNFDLIALFYDMFVQQYMCSIEK